MYNPHEILGVEEGADESTIRKRFKSLSKIYHPDKHNNDPSSIALYQIIRNSYDNLKESKKKIQLPMINSIDNNSKKREANDLKKRENQENDSNKKDIVVEGTNITENDIRILGEKFKDPWFHPSFELTEFFGDIRIPEKTKK